MEHTQTARLGAGDTDHSPKSAMVRSGAMMRAVVQERYGQPDVLALQDVPVPSPGPGEVLVRARASSVNYGDLVLLTGQPYPARLVLGLTRPRQRVPGMDMSGVVEAVGEGVTRFAPGDAVFGEVRGAFAERVCVAAERLARKSAALTFEETAALPIAATTALQGLRDVAQVKPGDRVLINGASGGVGTFAVQLAAHFGAEVTGVCSARNADMVRALGAAHVIDYAAQDFSAGAARYDVILDLVGSASISQCRRVLTPGGVYVSSVGRTGWSLRALLASLLPGSPVRVLVAKPRPEDLEALAQLADAGALRPQLDQHYTLGEVPEALQYQVAGHTRGKSVITI